MANQTMPSGEPPWMDTRKKYNINNDIKKVLGRHWEVEKKKIHKEIEI